MAELAQGVPNLRREMRILQITLEIQEKKIDEIAALIKERCPGPSHQEEQQREEAAP